MVGWHNRNSNTHFFPLGLMAHDSVPDGTCPFRVVSVVRLAHLHKKAGLHPAAGQCPELQA